MIGFTGTPLLKADRQRSVETFGPYIHTYKYDEAIHDKVVLDLRYEARDIDQHLASQAKVDQWFDLKTQGLSDLAKAQLRRRWGTMKMVASSRERIDQIVDDILHGHGDSRPVKKRTGQCFACVRQHLRGLPLLQALQRNRLERAGARSSRHISRPPATSRARKPGRGQPKGCSSTMSTGECSRTTLTRPRTTAMHKVRSVREGG